MSEERSGYFEEVWDKEGISSKPVDVSQERIDAALALKAKIDDARVKARDAQKILEDLLGSCDHKVNWDEWGHIYTFRYCAGCGKTVGLI